MILQIATKKRPLNPPTLASGPSQDELTKQNKNKYKQILAEQVAKLLIKRGMQNIDEWYLHHIVYEVAKTTPLDDGTLCAPPPQPIDDTKKTRPYDTTTFPQAGYSTGLSLEQSASMFKDGSNMSPQKSPSKHGINNKDRSTQNDELDDLTIDELRSLLDNFKNLSKSEQMDLIHYMKKLETSNPEKVRQLKSSFSSAMLAKADGNDETFVGPDGLGSAMLQVLARNMQRFTNDSSTGKSETHNR